MVKSDDAPFKNPGMTRKRTEKEITLASLRARLNLAKHELAQAQLRVDGLTHAIKDIEGS